MLGPTASVADESSTLHAGAWTLQGSDQPGESLVAPPPQSRGQAEYSELEP